LLYLVSMFARSDDTKSTIDLESCYATQTSFEDARSDRTRLFSDLLARQATSIPDLAILARQQPQAEKYRVITY
jgi:hypothetical protein